MFCVWQKCTVHFQKRIMLHAWNIDYMGGSQFNKDDPKKALRLIGSSPSPESSRDLWNSQHWCIFWESTSYKLELIKSMKPNNIQNHPMSGEISSCQQWWFRDDLWRRRRKTPDPSPARQTKPSICICNPSALNIPIKLNHLNTIYVFSSISKGCVISWDSGRLNRSGLPCESSPIWDWGLIVSGKLFEKISSILNQISSNWAWYLRKEI